MLQPLNDLAKVHIVKPEFDFGGDKKFSVSNGILVELPSEFDFYGYYSFAFDGSLMNKEVLKELHERWSKYIGKRVYWTQLAEKGSVLEIDDDKFAFVKLTSLIAVGEPDETAETVSTNEFNI